MLICIFFLTVIKRAFLSLQEKSSCILQTGVIVISLYRFAYRIKILLTDRLSEAISDAIFSFHIIIRCVRAGWPQGSPLQKRYKKCGRRADVGHRPLRIHTRSAGKNPPVTALPCQPPFRQGGHGDGGTDCHSQCAHWLRNDRVYKKCGERTGGGVRAPRPTERLQVVR